MALTDNLVAYYKLDESSGNAADSVNGYTLTNQSSAAYSAAKINNGIDFGTGNSAKSLYRNATPYNLGLANGNITIAYWIKLNTDLSGADTNGYYLSYQCYSPTDNYANSDGVGNCLWYRRTGGVNKLVYRRVTSPSTTDVSYDVTLGTSTFHYIAITWDGSYARLYLDGNKVAESATSSATGILNSPNLFILGAGQGGGSLRYGNFLYSNSIIDEAGAWTRALTGAEITQLYNSGAGLQYPFSSGNSGFFVFF